MKATPPGFTFLFKAFGMFTMRSAPIKNLPADVRAVAHNVSASSNLSASISLRELGPEATDRLWAAFFASIEPARAAGKLACTYRQTDSHACVHVHSHMHTRARCALPVPE